MAISRGIEVSGVNDEESPKTLEPLRDLGTTIYFQKISKNYPRRICMYIAMLGFIEAQKLLKVQKNW